MWRARLKERLLSQEPETLGRTGIASVLALVGQDSSGNDALLLTKRTHHVENHKGEISLPGGYWEAKDETLLATALRECQEEVGIPATGVEILGALQPVITSFSVLIQPWVGFLSSPLEVLPNPTEVERVLWLPVPRLVQEGLAERPVQVRGIMVQTPAIEIEREIVWGATGRILSMLRECLVEVGYGEPDPAR